eukprot:g70007.t1
MMSEAVSNFPDNCLSHCKSEHFALGIIRTFRVMLGGAARAHVTLHAGHADTVPQNRKQGGKQQRRKHVP